jgi:hypothetical protein
MPNNEGVSRKPFRMESMRTGDDRWTFVMELDEGDREKSTTVIRAVEGWNEGGLMIRIVPND